MRLTIEKDKLLRSLQNVHSAVEKRGTMPILSNVLIRAEDNLLSLHATDMDMAITDRVSANIVEDGAITVSAVTLMNIVSKLPGGAEISISKGDDSARLILQAGRSRFQLQCLNAEDFPSFGDTEMSHDFQIDAEQMLYLINHVKFAISTEETRYYLNGVYFHVVDGKELRAVATDGHRLARVIVDCPDGGKDMPDIIIPRKTITELARLLEDIDEKIMVSLSSNKIQFAFSELVIVSKLIDGKFPDYQRVIPEGNNNMLAIDRASFAEAVERVSTITTEKMRAVKLTMSTGAISISASSHESGDAQEELEADFSADELQVGFNSRYLSEICKQVGAVTIQFMFADAASPSIIRDPDDDKVLYVLMPMRV